MLVYVDDIIHLAHYPKEGMDSFNFAVRLKQESVGTPNRCLGANVYKVQMDNGKEFCSMHCLNYPQGYINNVDDIISKDHGACLKNIVRGRGDTHSITGPNWI